MIVDGLVLGSIPPEALAGLPPDHLVLSRIAIAPAVRVVSSPWPVFGIWRRNSMADAPKPEMRAEDVLIVRPEFDPRPVPLPPGGAAFVTALRKGCRVGDALDEAGGTPGFDLTDTLTALIAGAGITGLEDPT